MQVVIILVTCRILALLGHYLQQPRVIFEIIGGILLGPSAIGRQADSYYNRVIFAPSSLGYLSLVANIGLTLYLFLVGLELDPKLLQSHARKAAAISFFGISVPFSLGIAISQKMLDVLQADDPEFADVTFVSFAVFIGTALSITAFPVLARILKESGLIYTRAGAMVMGAAAIDDATAWCLLTLAISIANSGNMQIAGYVFLSVLCFAVGLIFLVRPVFEQLVFWVEKHENAVYNNNLFALTICLVFLCAWTTSLLGVHTIFGSFLFGLVVPRGSHLFKECNERIEELVLTVTLPIYFTISGLKTDVTQIKTSEQGSMIVLVCFVASIGKFLGTGLPAYFGGMSPRDTCVVAVLMNTRGLIELIVLNLGRSSGILNEKTFAVMVIMCLFTTFLTCPLLNYIYPVHLRTRHDVEEMAKLKDVEGNSDNTIDDASNPTSLDLFSSIKMSVVVDVAEHLQGIMKVISSFAPHMAESQLDMTILKFIEPTHTLKDEFLGLSDDGRLIRVEEEATDLSTYIKLKQNDIVKGFPDSLLLSMHCKAIGGNISSYRVQGDPDEFPIELRSLSLVHSSNIVLFPIRPSSYAQKFFWSSLRCVSIPILVLAQLDVVVSTEPEGRTRSDTLHYPRRRAGSQSSDPGAASDAPKVIGLGIGKRQSSSLFSPVPLGAPASNVGIHSVLVLLTYQATDRYLLDTTLRLATNHKVTFNVLRPKATVKGNKDMYNAFNAAVSNTYPNISIKELDVAIIDINEVIAECCKYSFDLFLSSYYQNFVSVRATMSPTSANQPVPGDSSMVTRQSRSASVSRVIGTIIPSAPENKMRQMLNGVPEILSDFEMPELGVIGSKLYTSGSVSFIMIMHDPHEYKSTIHPASPELGDGLEMVQ